MTTRQRNLKALIAQWGGPTALGLKLGYSNASYLSQMVGGHRPITEKTARKIEEALGLPRGWLDREHHTENAKAPKPASIDASLFSRVVVMVGAALSEMDLSLPPKKFDEVIWFVYDNASKTGQLDDTYIRRVLTLVK